MHGFRKIHAPFNTRLRSPAYLPHLTRVYLQSESHDKLLLGLSTVIPATGQPRPVTALALFIAEAGFNLDWCHQVHTLDVVCDSRLVDAFCVASDDVLPCLHHLAFTTRHSFLLAEFDLLPVFTFASKRPIETLRINGFDTTSLNVYAAIRCLVSMTGLISLNLDSLHSFPPSDLSGNELASLMPAGCWSRLTDLTLNDIDWNPQQAVCFIKAVPNLVTLSVSQESPFSWIPLVPVVAHCCPRIVSFLTERSAHDELVGDYVLDVQALPQLQAAYASWPLASMGFQHLQSLKVDGFDLKCLCLRWGLYEHSFECSDIWVTSSDSTFSWRFRTLADDPPVDGRMLFLDQLYCLLEDQEQLNQMDCCLEEESHHL